MNKDIVIQLRAMAPDKAMLRTAEDASYVFEKHDMTNLVDYDDVQLREVIESGKYILPADEGDIIRANNYEAKHGSLNGKVLLPLMHDGTIINYWEFVPKNSVIYRNLNQCGFKYADFEHIYAGHIDSYFTERLSLYSKTPCAYKTVTGSGSRGVLLIDPQHVHLGGKFRDQLTTQDVEEFIKFAKSERCGLIQQELIPFEGLDKVNCDFVIRDGKLLGYKWDIVNKHQLFTNWDNFHIYRTDFTDVAMARLTEYLVSCGIKDAIMNFEAFSDHDTDIWMVEFNWRYSNSMFESFAFDVDLVDCYLKNKPFEMPFGSHKAVRYWQCKLYSEIPHEIGVGGVKHFFEN
jgi:hypothetical protein